VHHFDGPPFDLGLLRSGRYTLTIKSPKAFADAEDRDPLDVEVESGKVREVFLEG